jgi:AcrR family transcriptional regulator
VQARITESHIVEAAAQVFSRHGFNGTSTREIARRAEVPEATMFRHFPRKQDLFWAALVSHLDRLRMPEKLRTGLARNGDPQTVVPLIAEFMVQTTIHHPELVRMLAFSLLELRVEAEPIYRQRLVPIFQAIIDYLAGCVTRRVLRSVDPSFVALSFAFTILAHQELCQLFTTASTRSADAEKEAVITYSSLWLNALLPASTVVKPI